ncbi:hypothetical protein PBI_VALIDUS_85 [Mycobacterium phage Validus]|uniref:Uncharacterized protein n=1 Tax=Mycobacterium phage Validus TaxID=1414747 RepID=V5UQE4_9CAUD|nr:hypothetical protein CC50_gp026 [Mycobacterium phage Validus]AHB79615.1 hypothetical protein PBI_VALIDUS_85 [Mycobacterium phage Validus]
MSARYYVQRTCDCQAGPFPSYSEAARHHALRAMFQPGPPMPSRVLLDVGSVEVVPSELSALLRDDPLLSAVFKLGAQSGAEEYRRYVRHSWGLSL